MQQSVQHAFRRRLELILRLVLRGRLVGVFDDERQHPLGHGLLRHHRVELREDDVDLVHAGVLGLFDATNKYNPDEKVVFHSYAKYRIKAPSWTACASSTGLRATCARGRKWWKPSRASSATS